MSHLNCIQRNFISSPEDAPRLKNALKMTSEGNYCTSKGYALSAIILSTFSAPIYICKALGGVLNGIACASPTMIGKSIATDLKNSLKCLIIAVLLIVTVALSILIPCILSNFKQAPEKTISKSDESQEKQYQESVILREEKEKTSDQLVALQESLNAKNNELIKANGEIEEKSQELVILREEKEKTNAQLTALEGSLNIQNSELTKANGEIERLRNAAKFVKIIQKSVNTTNESEAKTQHEGSHSPFTVLSRDKVALQLIKLLTSTPLDKQTELNMAATELARLDETIARHQENLSILQKEQEEKTIAFNNRDDVKALSLQINDQVIVVTE